MIWGSSLLRPTRPAAVAAVALLAAVGGLSACGGSSQSGSGGGEKSVYVLGATEALTGASAFDGTQRKQSWGGYVDYVNAHGGINGHKLKFVIYDDHGDAGTAIANVRRLITQDHAVAVAGATSTNMCESLAPLAQQYKTALMCYSGDETLLKPTQKYVFAEKDPERVLAQPIINFIDQQLKLGHPRVGTLSSTAGGSVIFGNTVQAETKRHGWDVAGAQTLPLDPAANVTGPVAALLATQPNVIVSEIYPTHSTQLVKAISTAGASVPIVSEVTDYTTLSTYPENYYQEWQSQIVDPSGKLSAGAKQFVDVMRAGGVNDIVGINAGHVPPDYLAAVAIGAALKSCGDSCTGDSVATALAKTKVTIPGMATGWGFTPTAHYPAPTVAFYHVVKGKAVQAGSATSVSKL